MVNSAAHTVIACILIWLALVSWLRGRWRRLNGLACQDRNPILCAEVTFTKTGLAASRIVVSTLETLFASAVTVAFLPRTRLWTRSGLANRFTADMCCHRLVAARSITRRELFDFDAAKTWQALCFLTGIANDVVIFRYANDLGPVRWTTVRVFGTQMVNLNLLTSCTLWAVRVVAGYHLTSEGNSAIIGTNLSVTHTGNTLVPIKRAYFIPTTTTAMLRITFVNTWLGYTNGNLVRSSLTSALRLWVSVTASLLNFNFATKAWSTTKLLTGARGYRRLTRKDWRAVEATFFTAIRRTAASTLINLTGKSITAVVEHWVACIRDVEGRYAGIFLDTDCCTRQLRPIVRTWRTARVNKRANLPAFTTVIWSRATDRRVVFLRQLGRINHAPSCQHTNTDEREYFR